MRFIKIRRLSARSSDAICCALRTTVYYLTEEAEAKIGPPERLRERRGLSPDLDASTSTKQVCLAGAPAQDSMIFLRQVHTALTALFHHIRRSNFRIPYFSAVGPRGPPCTHDVVCLHISPPTASICVPGLACHRQTAFLSLGPSHEKGVEGARPSNALPKADAATKSRHPKHHSAACSGGWHSELGTR